MRGCENAAMLPMLWGKGLEGCTFVVDSRYSARHAQLHGSVQVHRPQLHRVSSRQVDKVTPLHANSTPPSEVRWSIPVQHVQLGPVLGAQQLHSLSEQRRARETTGATAVWTLTHTGAHLLDGEVATVDDNVAPGLHGGVRSGHALFAIAAAAFVDGVLVHSNPRVRRKAAAERVLPATPASRATLR